MHLMSTSVYLLLYSLVICLSHLLPELMFPKKQCIDHAILCLLKPTFSSHGNLSPSLPRVLVVNCRKQFLVFWCVQWSDFFINMMEWVKEELKYLIPNWCCL